MFAAAKSGGVVASSGDPYWTSVSLLTNFENNLTFQDGSTNNIALTRNGVVNPSLATPFTGGVGGSEYFNGSTGYVSGTTSTAAEFGTGDFTVEAFLYLTSAPSYALLFGTSGLNMYFGIAVYGVAPLYRLTAYDGATLLEQTAGTSFTLNAWNHVAWVRSGTTFTAYLNGASVYSTTNSRNITGTTGFQVGHSPNYVPYYVAGNISNFRIVKGTAVYTTAFTPPTAPLTAITNTSLLITGTGQGMFNNSTFVDQGPNALTVTATGAPVYSGLSPFGNTYAGSVKFDGTSQYLSAPDNAALNMGTSDFTVESWVYTNSGTTGAIVSKDGTSAVSWPQYQLAITSGGKFEATISTTTTSSPPGSPSARLTGTTTIIVGTWYHVAVTRVGTNATLWINGVSEATSSTVPATLNTRNQPTTIGTLNNGGTGATFLNGFLSNLRIVKGTAVYTANFTPSTTPLTAITNTSLLVRGDTGAFYDLSNNGLAETGVGTPVVTTQVKKFGSESVFLNGSSYLSVANSTALQFGSGDATIEFWINVTSTAGVQQIFNTGSGPSTNLSYAMIINAGSLLYYLSSTGSTWDIASGVTVGAITANTWTYVALVRSGNTWTPYVNSVAGTTTTNAAALFNFTSAIPIGQSAGAQYITGYLDDIRFTKGVARTITTPTVTFPTGP